MSSKTKMMASGIFQFDYQDNSSVNWLPRQDFRTDLSTFFLTNEELDFSLVALVSTSDRGRPVSSYPWVKLIGETGKAEKGDPSISFSTRAEASSRLHSGKTKSLKFLMARRTSSTTRLILSRIFWFTLF